MAYIKTTWENEPSESTPINATNLNKIENGIYNNSLITDTVGDVNNLNTTDKSSVVNAINENTENISGFGKLLWEGNFTSGSITVDGLSDYTVIIVKLNAGTGVYCIGSKNYGGTNIGVYASYGISQAAYRLANPSPNVLSITAEDKGGTTGSSQIPIIAIYGLF